MVTGLVLALALGAGLVVIGQRFVLFPRPGAPDPSPAFRVPGLEPLLIDRASGVDAWLLSPTSGASPSPLVIFAHGNAELIDHWAPHFGPLRDAGYAVLLVEYPGYGRSAGSPSQQSITDALLAAYDYVVEREDIRADAVVGYGRSLGGAAICQLAARRRLRGLVLESTFRGVRPIARGLGVPAWLVRDPFDSEAILADYPGPVLILHGDRDRIVPVEHARALHRIARDSELRTFPCGHNDCPRPWSPILAFLQGRVGLSGASP